MPLTPDKFDSLRKRAEQLLSASNDATDHDSRVELKSVFHELDTYRIEIELQNDELINTHQQLQELHQDYLNLYDFAPVAYATVDANGQLIKANHSLNILLGLSKLQLLKHALTDFVLDIDQDILYLYRQSLLDKLKPQPCEIRLLNYGGQVIWVRCEGFFKNATSTNDINFIFTDITLIKNLEDDLRIAASFFDESDEAIMVTDSDLNILKVNHAFSKITGYSSAEVVGQKPNLLKSGKQDDLFYQEMWLAINTYNHWQGELWNQRKNGEIYPEWLSISARKNTRNETTHYIGRFSDITHRKDTDTLIHFMAYYDALTKLPNRILLQDRISNVLFRARRNDHYSALMLLDLDHFKVINDALGHEVGDNLLIEVAKRLLASVREEDTVARLGGDEFVILLHELSLDQKDAELKASHIAEKICRALENKMLIDNHNLHISASIGIATFSGETENASDLVKNADNAMYIAKKESRYFCESLFWASQPKQAAKA